MAEPKPTPEALQEESATLMSSLRPLLDTIDMAIRREAKPSDLEASWREVKAINRRFNAIQKQIRRGAATR
jgi:hypothetical protein